MSKKLINGVFVILLSALSALNYKVFVFPNSFAPAGIDGICTMIQYIFGTNIGYLSLLVNIPLIIVGFSFLSKDFMVKTLIYVVSFSAVSLILEFADFIPLYYTDTGTSIVLAPMAAGTVRGILYSVTLGAGASSGGVDIIAALVKRKREHLDLMGVIFAFNLIVSLCAFFVYGFKFEPVICSIIYSLITTLVSQRITASKRIKVRVEIITKCSDKLCAEITEVLNLPATVLPARGAYSGIEEKMVICVTPKDKVPLIEKIIRTYPDAVSFESIVSNAFVHTK